MKSALRVYVLRVCMLRSCKLAVLWATRPIQMQGAKMAEYWVNWAKALQKLGEHNKAVQLLTEAQQHNAQVLGMCTYDH